MATNYPSTGEVFLTRSRSGTQYESEDTQTGYSRSEASTPTSIVSQVSKNSKAGTDDEERPRSLKKPPQDVPRWVSEEQELDSDAFDTDLEDDFPPGEFYQMLHSFTK